MELIISHKTPYLPVLGGREIKIVLEADSKPYSENCQIAASNDLEAVGCWLKRHQNNPNTLSAYAKEARRLLAWCVYEKGLPIGALKVQDFEAYFAFLKNPPIPWYSIVSDAKSGKVRSLLQKGLSESACRMALRSVNALMNYLVEADYLRTNPMKLLKNARDNAFEKEIQKYQVWERMLEVDEWEAVQQALQTMPAGNSEEIDNRMRTQFLFALLYLLGLRIHEVALSSWNAFRQREGHWWFFIKGKGGKLAHVPVNEQLLAYVKAYRLHVGLSPLPQLMESQHLLVSQRTQKPLKVRQLYGLVKAIGRAAAKSFTEQPLKKKKLEQFSPHWLRHLSASHQDKAGIPALMIQANHRHSSYQTTQIYLHAEETLRANEIQKLRMPVEPGLIVKPSLPKKFTLTLTLKGNSLSHKMHLSHFLASLESQVLREIAWKRAEPDLNKLLNHYEYLKKFGEPFTIHYDFNDFKEAVWAGMEKAIKREAVIRLFECQILLRAERV